MIKIREELPEDTFRIQSVHDSAFENNDEGKLVNALRQEGSFTQGMSLVALEDGQIVDHILFSDIKLDGNHQHIKAAALAPVGVLPEYQGEKIGSKLIQAGLKNLADLGYEAIFVIGDTNYYQRFGFSLQLATKVQSDYSGSNFMALELKAATLSNICSSKATYPKAFKLV